MEDVEGKEVADYNSKEAKFLASEIDENLEGKELTVEEIQDTVEEVLMEHNKKIAKEYILYRQKRKENREHWLTDELPLDIFERKYQFEGESFEEFFERVANGNENMKKYIKNKEFLPAGRILANRGLHKHGIKVTYSNCYVIEPPKDSIESIFDTSKELARTFSYGGGAGIDISNLRPQGAKVNNASKYTTGSTSFMPLYSLTTGIIGQKGRRGALMISIDVTHPDIEQFIDIKNELGNVEKANISVKVTDEFITAVKNNGSIILDFLVEDTGEYISKEVDANKIMNMIAYGNWNTGEPGFLYWDEIEDYNLLSNDIEFSYAGVNPCAEEPLPAGGSCLLGHINLAEMVEKPFTDEAEVNYKKLGKVAREGVIFLNEVLDEGLDLHPLEQQQNTVRDYRQIGMGIMGLADMFIKLGVEYGSERSLELIDKLGKFIANTALRQSAYLAKEHGTYPAFDWGVVDTKYFKTVADDVTEDIVKEHGLRNSQLLTIAPTGSTSTMLNVSGGIEPLYQLSYERTTKTLHEEEKTYTVYPDIVEEFMEVKGIEDTDDLPDYFVSAFDLDPKQRIDVQAKFQKYIDASISSTINLPNGATVNDIKELYLYGAEKNLKGMTVFRNGCKRAGILSDGKDDDKKVEMNDMDFIEQGICPECKTELNQSEGCTSCPSCGYSACSV